MEKLLVAGLDDWLHLADVAWAVRYEQPELSERAVIDAATGVIGAMLARGLARASDVTDGGFIAWAVQGDEAIVRIKQGWLALGREPEPGDVCWIANTSSGDEAALACLRRDEP